MLTINEFIDTLKTLAEAHRQVRSFAYGEVWDISPDMDREYPLVYATLGNPSFSGVEVTYRVSLRFLDRVQLDHTNARELSSDQLLTALDIVAQLKSPAYFDDFTLNLEGDFQHIVDGEDDLLVGWLANVSIRVPFEYDRCQVPSSVVPSRITAPCDPVTIYGTDGVTVLATVSAGGSYVQPQITVVNALGTGVLNDYDTELNSTPYADFTAAQHESNLSVTKRNGLSRIYPLPTGKVTSYVQGDDGYYQFGRLVNRTTLKENNTFGNTNRFTDIGGGQNYSGNNNLVIDHATGLMWYKTDIAPNQDWSSSIATAEALSQGGFSDWRMPDSHEMDSIIDKGSIASQPFAFATNGYNLWCSTSPDTTNAYRYNFNGNTLAWTAIAKSTTSNMRTLVVRTWAT